LLVQVAGRAGRGKRPGRVLIQTRFPGHPLLQTLVRDGYAAFAAAALEERRCADLPPFSHQVLLRADAETMERAQAFLAGLARHLGEGLSPEVAVWGPVPAPMARRGRRYRAQLLLQAVRRDPLHRVLSRLPELVAKVPGASRVRWGLDVDPVDLY
jgi:primosomal protein N' (replication factor Y)